MKLVKLLLVNPKLFFKYYLRNKTSPFSFIFIPLIIWIGLFSLNYVEKSDYSLKSLFFKNIILGFFSIPKIIIPIIIILLLLVFMTKNMNKDRIKSFEDLGKNINVYELIYFISLIPLLLIIILSIPDYLFNKSTLYNSFVYENNKNIFIFVFFLFIKIVLLFWHLLLIYYGIRVSEKLNKLKTILVIFISVILPYFFIFMIMYPKK